MIRHPGRMDLEEGLFDRFASSLADDLAEGAKHNCPGRWRNNGVPGAGAGESWRKCSAGCGSRTTPVETKSSLVAIGPGRRAPGPPCRTLEQQRDQPPRP